MINLTLRNSSSKSYFKENLLKLCSTPGDIFILSYGYFHNQFSNDAISNENLPDSLSNLFTNLITTLAASNTKTIYIIGGQYSIPNYSDLSPEEKYSASAIEDTKITIILENLTNLLNSHPSKPSRMKFYSCYTSHFHAKLSIKLYSTFTGKISILMGSSNLTLPSIIEGNSLSYYNIESDILLTDINTNDITFNNDASDLCSFLNSIHPLLYSYIILDT